MVTENRKKYYILAFVLGCLPFLVSVITFTAQNDWIFYVYSDFNSQQIPFTIYISEHLSEFSFPQFDFNIGSGLDYLNAYSYYNMLSPFTLIYAVLPQNAVMYAIPFVIALKFGMCSLGAYIYASRSCKTSEYAMICGIIYAYSGFHMVNLVLTYLDGLAFFPFLLAALEAAVNDKKRVVFGAAVFLCSVTNYYIFGMDVVFLVIYFLIRLTDKSFRINLKDFFCLALESVLGVMAAGFIMIPAVVCMINSPRLGEPFHDIAEMLLYEKPWRYPRILQAIFMMPDLQGYTNFFPDTDVIYPSGSRWSSQAMYIPMFGVSGFIAYMSANKKSWQTKLIALCLVIAFIPVLNSIFSMGSSIYYARWMFAPTLIMAAMTACALENEPKYFKPGLIINGAAILLITVFALIFPIEKLSQWNSTVFYNSFQKWVQIAVTFIGIILIYILIFKVKRDAVYPRNLLAAVVVFAFVVADVTLAFDMSETAYPELIKISFSNSKQYPDIERTEQGSRVATDFDLKNKTLLWNVGATYCFTSIISSYAGQYYDSIEISHDDVHTHYPTQCLLSAKTYLAYDSSHGNADMTDKARGHYGIDMFEFSEQKDPYLYFENTNYIPMGFCYDHCISKEDFLSLDKEVRERLVLKAMVVDDVSAVSEYLEPIPEGEIYLLDDEGFSAECSKRAETTAYSYKTDDDSYTAEIILEEPELVFFSVAYDEGFTAYVDGKETEIINANFGFQAIPVPAGTHTIHVKYHSVWRDIGLVSSIAGLSGMILYTVMCCILHRKRKN